MLTKMSEILKYAKKGSYGVPALGAADEMTLRACIDAAEEMMSPIIILCMHNGNKDLNYFGRILNDLALQAKVPIATMLDHTPTFESAIAGIRAGFNSIMVDRSSLPYKENLAQVKELVRIAHAVDIEVEAELGCVGFEDDSDADFDLVFTVPEEAVSFVEESGIECLAVSIGTAHGAYKGEPKLQFELLQELESKVSIPLALHGGSGSGDENLAKACRLGISKVNIVNDLYRSAFNAVEKDGMAGNRIYNLLSTLYMGYKEKAMHFMKVFGSAGKA
jgi:fructose-bisphosphate aldolase class II